MEVCHMNEKNFCDWDVPFKNKPRNYGKMTELTSVEEIRLQESISYNLSWYNIPAKVFDEFLVERFGHSIEGFRKLYLRRHLADFSENQISWIAQFANPIPANIRAYFGEVSTPFEVIFKYNWYRKIIETHSCSGALPLHNDTISNFTIIRARFSELAGEGESLEEMKKKHNLGYYFSDKKFRFFISSSIQFDLTVIYEEI